jgi:hypothetical protein
VGVNRRGQVGLELTDVFRRSASVQALNFGTAVISNSNELTVQVPFRPGGGALVTTASGAWRLETFEAFDKTTLCLGGSASCDTNQLAKLGYSDVTAGLESRWKFLPRTAALVQGEYFLHQPSSAAFGDKGSGVRAWAGLAGLFGAHLAGTVKAGYGDTLGSFGSGFRSWLANLEAEWLPVETTSLKVGYLHDYGADPGKASLYSSHRGYLEAHTLLEGRYLFKASASYEHRIYELAQSTSADLLRVEPSVEVEVARWLRVAGGYAFTKRTSSFPGNTPALPGFSFDKHEVYLRVTGTY